MVKTYGPMFSLEAAGTIGKAITFSKWKGRSYVRQRVKPANPRSALQVSVRAMMKFLTQAWTDIDTTAQGSWEDRAAASEISPFNAYCGRNLQIWDQFEAPAQTDPKAGTGTLPTATLDSATGGENHVNLTFTITTLSDVWGVMIFRSTSGSFDTALSNCVAVIPITATGTKTWTDSNLAAGTYYYDARFFTKEGNLGPEEGEVNGTAT